MSDSDLYKKCKGCKEFKIRELFGIKRSVKDGRNGMCLDCYNRTKRDYYRIRRGLNGYDYSYDRVTHKKCGKCKEIKLLKGFYDSKTGRGGKASTCGICARSLRKKYYYSNRNKCMEMNREYTIKTNKNKMIIALLKSTNKGM